MSDAGPSIDDLMQQASVALTRMRYLECEKLCLDALSLAKQAADYETYARILLPLQEARRQRRQDALEAGVVVLTHKSEQDVRKVLDTHTAGCLMLIDPPFTADDEHTLRAAALERELLIEVLRLDGRRLRSTFEHEMEVLGDTELAKVSRDLPPQQQVQTLEQVLHRVGDHEIAHQRLADAARQAAHERAVRQQ